MIDPEAATGGRETSADRTTARFLTRHAERR
jgi:hypothetical protein